MADPANGVVARPADPTAVYGAPFSGDFLATPTVTLEETYTEGATPPAGTATYAVTVTCGEVAYVVADLMGAAGDLVLELETPDLKMVTL